MPPAIALSMGLTDDARTRTVSSSSLGSGSGSSSRSRGSESKFSRTNPFILKNHCNSSIRVDGLDPLPQCIKLHVREEPVGGRRVELIDVVSNPEAELSVKQL